MNRLKQAIGNVYITVREILWASPLVRWSLTVNMIIWLGYVSRRLLRLAPQEDAIGLVRGHRMWFGPGSECYLDMTRGTWEPGVTELFERLLLPGMVVVDVGAHIGYFTLLAARRVGPTGRVYAFEPVPYNYNLLVKNIALNGYENIVPVQKAVSDKVGTATFYIHPNQVGHSFYPETLGRSKTAITVETTTLDQFFSEQGWPPVQMVKMDIEGAEPAALEGMAKVMQKAGTFRLIFEYIPRILLRAGLEPRQFLDRVNELGFTMQNITDDHGLQPLNEKVLRNPNLRAELFCERNTS